MLFFIFLILHLLICAGVFFGIKFNLLKVHKYMFFVALFLPLWGVLVLLVLHFQIFFEADGGIDVGVEKLKLDSELYKSVTVDESRSTSILVPIEEALVVNSARERRAIIMDILNDNPKEYINFLQKAGNNEDTEVVHYAVTAMVEISKENDYKLQDFERKYLANPDDLQLVSDYAAFLWSVLSQNLLQGQVELINRELFSALMQKKIENSPSVLDFTRAIKNELARKNYTLALEKLKLMEKVFPNYEDYYLMAIDYFAALQKGDEVKRILKELEESNIFLSASTKEVLAFWKT